MKIQTILIAISLTGCYSEKKLSKVCADKFPIKEEIKEIVINDTIITKGDTIKINFKDTSLSFICPPNKTIIQTKEIKITAENTAKTYLIKKYYQNKIDILNKNNELNIKKFNEFVISKNKEIDKINKKLNNVKKYKYRFYILLSLIIIYFAFSFRKLFSFLY